jgi:signal peptidase I
MPEKITDIDIVLAVLESGNSVELPATGYSMYPALKPGFKVTVAPFDEMKAVIGNVVICKSDNGLVMHRLIEKYIDNSGKTIYITQGDSRKDKDVPRPKESIIGVAVSYNTDGKGYPVKSFLPGKLKRRFNYCLLWIFLMLKKTVQVLGMR